MRRESISSIGIYEKFKLSKHQTVLIHYECAVQHHAELKSKTTKHQDE